MKLRFMKALLLLLFLLMLLFPARVFAGASKGLLLWFHSVIPTLLPFMILSAVLIKTQAIHWIARLSGPMFRRLFAVSDHGSFAVIAGFLCGYPMGSRVTADLLREKHISFREAGYLLSFCNNASPVFIISYIVQQNLKREDFLVPALTILFLSPFLTSLLFRRLPLYTRFTARKTTSPEAISESFPDKEENLLDVCIMNSFESVVKIGGYMILFSVILSLAEMFTPALLPVRNLLLSSLEITNGIALICSGTSDPQTAFFFCMVTASFGGWCAIAQTRCMIAGTGLSIIPYMIEKLATASVTSLLCLLYFAFL